MSCPKCQSKNTTKRGIQILHGGVRRQKYHCKDCGHIWY